MIGSVILGSVSLTAGAQLIAQHPTVVATHPQTDASLDALLARRVTIHLTNVPLKQAIDSVSQVAKVFVEYRLSLLKVHPELVTVNVTDTPLGVVLEQVLNGTGLRMASGVQGSLTIVAVQESRADSVPTVGIVTGRVIDSATGHGLLGVTVKIAGTKISTTTQDSGRFTLQDVAIGQQLVTAKVFGYRPVERTVDVTAAQAITIRISLSIVPTVLSGVVTTATGFQRKVEVGNDITSINVDSVMQIAPITSITDLLETRVPGLTVLHSSGVPGDPARLRLRGVGSVQGNNDAIVIVDGVRVYASQSDTRNANLAPSRIGGTNGGALLVNAPGNSLTGTMGAYAAPSPLDMIDPNSIETVEVFKGPSASALYGSDAANGVIVVTTKHGHAGPTHWSMNVTDGVNSLPGNWPINYYRFGWSRNFTRGVLCPWNAPTGYCAVDSVVAYQALNDPQFSLFSQGSDQQASLTVSGGVPALQYSLTGSGQRTLGNLKLPGFVQHQYDSLYGPIPKWMVRPDNYQTSGITGSLTATPSPQIRVEFQSSVHTSTQQRSSLEGAISQLEGMYIGGGNVLGIGGIFQSLGMFPLVQGYVEKATDYQVTSANTATLNWQLRSWLPLTATAGVNTIQRVDNSYVPYGITASGLGTAGCISTDGQYSYDTRCDTTGSYGLGRGTSRNQTLTVGTSIPMSSHLTVAVGGNQNAETTNDFQIYTNLLAPGVTVPTTFQTLQRTNTTGVDTVIVINSPSAQNTAGTSTYGVYLQTQIHLAESLYLNPGFRLDGGSGGSTSAGSVQGLSAFPKLDLSYLAVDRQNAQPLWGVLTLLRPRVAFGLAGTQPALADRLRLFNVGTGVTSLTTGGQPGETLSSGGGCGMTTLDGSTLVPGVCLSTLGNTQLRPERSSELEGGFDATLWQGRVTLTYSRYNKTRRDAILSVPVEASIGPFNIEKNIGEIRNTGTELTLNTSVLQSRALSWNVGANVSNDNSLVVRLNPGQPPLCYGTVANGNGPCQGERVAAGFPLFGVWARPIVSFVDANHDNVIEANEIRYGDSAVYVGQPNPKYQLALTTDLMLFSGRLGIHATFDYQNGLTQNNQGACTSGELLSLPNAPNTPLATQAAVVAAGCGGQTGYGNGFSQIESQIGLIQTVNLFRFNALSINYHVPQHVSSWVRVPRMTVALQGSNLGLHSNYRGKDPGVNAFSTVSAGDETADVGQIPEPRIWQLMLTLGN